MELLDFESLKYCSYILIIIAFIYFISKNDELPIIIAYFFYATGISRLEAIQSGEADWIVVNYTDNFFELNDDLAIYTLHLFLIGSLIFMLSYMTFRAILKKNAINEDNQDLFVEYTYDKQQVILWGAIIFFPLSTAAMSMISGSGALGNSYFWLFSLAVGGIIILLYNCFRLLKENNMAMNIVYIVILIYAAITSFNPTVRFQFLSWMIAVGIFFCGKLDVRKKLKYYLVGGISVIIIFAIAGVARNKEYNSMTWKERFESAIERNDSREDQNMLDGFMMVLQVYPERLEYQYGMEHLSVLARPIPRQLWPNKPLGGYANKLGLNDVEKGTVGISQTLYGSLFEEGGVWGIMILSLVYGYLFANVIAYSEKFNSDVRWMIKGVAFASLLPLLRGGDLPGVYAFIGMSFWPVFIFIHYYLKKIKYGEA